MLGDFIHLDFGFRSDFSPHADNGLDHFVVLGFKAPRGLDLETNRIICRIARFRQQHFSFLGIMCDTYRRVERRVLRRLQGVDRNAIPTKQVLDDRILVDSMSECLADVGIFHHFDIIEENHADVGNRRALADQSLFGSQSVVLLVWNLDCDVGTAAFDFRDAAAGIGHKFENDCLELWLGSPILVKTFQPDKTVSLELIDHIRAGTDRRGLKPFSTNFLVIFLWKDISGKKCHPLEQCRLKRNHITGDSIAIDAEIGNLAPNEHDWIAGVGMSGSFKRPHNILGCDLAAVMPVGIVTDFQPYFCPILIPSPTGQQSGLETQVRILINILIEYRLVDGLDGRIDCRQANRWIP